MTLSPERRAEILAAVGAWLDMHADEPLPPGIDPSLTDDPAPAPDLATVVEALVALRHDVKLQTKAFKRVDENLGTALAELETEHERVRAAADAAADLIELHDRLRRCAVACDEAQRTTPWLSRRASVERRLSGIGDGIELVADRARAMLAEHGFRPFDPVGQVFDAGRMRAVGQAPADGTARAGCVATTVRVGIERVDDATVVRPAEVLVAREETAS